MDGDNDGIPDAWELLHFGAAGTTADADDDGDGMSSFGEYAFGLNPHSGDLTALPQPALSGGLMTITVTKRPYIAYTVVASESLAAGSFSVTGLTTVTDDAQPSLSVKPRPGAAGSCKSAPCEPPEGKGHRKPNAPQAGSGNQLACSVLEMP